MTAWSRRLLLTLKVGWRELGRVCIIVEDTTIVEQMVFSPQIALKCLKLLLVYQRLCLHYLFHSVVEFIPHYPVQLIDNIHLARRCFPPLESEPAYLYWIERLKF